MVRRPAPKRLILLFPLLFAGSGCLWQGEEIALTGVDTRLTILHTSDIHSRLFPFDLEPNQGDQSLGLHSANAPFGGVARLGYLIRRERQRSDRVLHLDSGDCFQGAPVFNVSLGEPEMRFLSMIGLDAAVIGNHEFDAGVSNLVEQLAGWATYDNLAANYDFPNTDDVNHNKLADHTAPFGIYNLRGLRVAVIGMANLGSLTSIGEGGNSLQITPLEQNETVRSYVNLLHDSVDLIVVLTHLGLTEDEELITGYEKIVWADRVHPNWEVLRELGDGRVEVHVPGVRGIDIIVGGHLHVVLNPPKVIVDRDGREVPLVHSGAFSKFLGRLDLVVRDDPEMGGKRVVAHKYQVFPVDNRLAEYEDPLVNRMLEPYALELGRQIDLRRVVGYAPSTITRFSSRGNGDSGLGNLVGEAMRARRRIEAEFAVTNTLGIRDNIYAGPITLEDMFNVFPFENTLATMYLSAAEVQELADYITFRSASRGCNAQAQVAGITFTMNCAQVLVNEAGGSEAYQHPAEDITINGAPINPLSTYKLATNDYIAGGGSGFHVLKRNTTTQDSGVSMRDALVDYISTMRRCGEYEIHGLTGTLEGPQVCLAADDYSRRLCADVVACDAYIAACEAGCATEDPTDNLAVPTACGGTGITPTQEACHDGSDPCEGDPNIRGPYASAPCVVSEEDGRMLRKTTEGLDGLPDPTDEGEVP